MEVDSNDTDVPSEKSTPQETSSDVSNETSNAITSENHEKSDAIDDKKKNNDDDESQTCEKTTSRINLDSFKKPTLLIGPRRGKVGQLRTLSDGHPTEATKVCEQSYVQPEKIVAKNTTQDNAEADKVKSTACDKQQIPLQYREPAWGGPPLSEYKIEVLKSGVILHAIDICEKSFYVVGRLPTCDISLAHPTVSRYHAILQYRITEDDKQSKGFYLYDLGSTHGTFWNGRRIRSNTYVKVSGGHMIRFGCSQRKFIIQAPPDDVEEESELSVTELKEKRRLELSERERSEKERKQKEEEEERLRLLKEEEDGVNWGMAEDADEETDLTVNPYALTNNEELFLDDPKKTLRGWFEREGHDLQYETEEKGIGQFLCWVDLPLDTATGRPVRAEALIKGKKKEAVIQCALEACRILDRHGVLRQATHEARKRKSRNWEEEDFYDSDEDNFLDRTGTVEKKRERRMRQAGKLDDKIETYASLLEKHLDVKKKIVDIDDRLKKTQKLNEANMENANEDALDAFMSSLNTAVLNKAEVTKMKLELQSLRKEEERLLKLVNITKPANLPSLSSQTTIEDAAKSEKIANATKNSNSSGQRRSNADLDSRAIKKSSSLVEKIDEDEKNHETNLKIEEATSEEGAAGDSKKSKISIKLVDDVDAIKTENPSNAESSKNVDKKDIEKNDNDIVKKKMKNMKRMQQRAEKAGKETPKGYEGDSYSEDYSMWLPPVDQSGDGKTNLNDKYGY